MQRTAGYDPAVRLCGKAVRAIGDRPYGKPRDSHRFYSLIPDSYSLLSFSYRSLASFAPSANSSFAFSGKVRFSEA